MSKQKLIIIHVTVLFAAGCQNAGSEYFTGTVEYSYAYTSDSLNVDSLSKARPSKGLFRYDAGNYQSRFINHDSVTYYYSGKLNKCIAEAGNRKNYECEDYSIATDSVLSIKAYTTEEKLLGYGCRVIEMQKQRSLVKYYFSTDIRLAPVTYEKHMAYNWDIYGEKAGGGLVLQLEHRFEHFTMKGIATSLKKFDNFKALEIDDSVFARSCN